MRELLKSAWALLREGNRDDAQVALAVSAIALCTGVGLIFTFFFGLTARLSVNCGLFCHISGGGLAVLAAAGAFSAGGVLGLLFGAPRWGDGSAPAAQADGAPGGTAAVQSTPSNVRPNTSLEKVADWLTTIIVGLGLVHLKDLEGRLTDMGIWLTNAITLEARGLNGTPGVVLALSFSVAGFLMVYLWSLRFLPSEIEGAYAAIKRLKQQKENLTKTLEKFRTDPLFNVTPEVQAAITASLKAGGVDDATVGDVVKRYTEATRWIDEPMKEFGPAELEGYKLSVVLKDLQPGIWMFTATLDNADLPPEDKALFLLHNSYSPNVCIEGARTKPGFKYESQTNGAFWLGAIVVRPGKSALRLSLDLRTLPGATDAFKDD